MQMRQLKPGLTLCQGAVEGLIPKLAEAVELMRKMGGES